MPSVCVRAANDGLVAAAQRETTGRTTAQSFTICGQLDPGHPDGDVDSYTFDVPADVDVLLRGEGDFTGLDIVDVVLYANTNFNEQIAYTRALGSHAVRSVGLLQNRGTHEISIYTSSNVTTPVPYKLIVALDTPATRCPRIAGAATYTETREGANDSTLNDMIDVNLSAPSRRTGRC